ncbi:SIS domain-containing protein [Geothrix sp. PMB-07]|uniref:KpsF/GutQ family sugar-phosphate isomerase n=1 Tax=Geothrix sp. PMB-07 TaxID=3068640 RepID=UPI002741CEE5|nr:KpsF/GutQ family sugar-phosphate isomerase [Geothrix sp. PMB-07]WLT33499.1 KpsF/GutQ family sugar-phosphate isomerase [Geothrix sp. PMB-07]
MNTLRHRIGVGTVKDENQVSPAGEAGNAVLDAASAGLDHLRRTWDPKKTEGWVNMVVDRSGRVILTGMGKSGLVAQKIAATLASTGSPSFFLHPAEALHGDLGMVTREDSILALSNSGESEEVVRLLPSLLRLGIPIAAITARPDSSLGQAATWTFDYQLPQGEGCPLELAPMASTTLQLVWGDLLAASLMARRGFTRDLFALNHPAGTLGAKLLKVGTLMHKTWPVVSPMASLVDVLKKMTDGRLGMTSVMADEALLGVITDGDIRRALGKAESEGRNPLNLTADQIMTRHPASIEEGALALEAAGTMESRKITFLMVTRRGQPCGVLHIHDLLASKVL